MRREVARDLTDSAYDFQRAVWPVVKDWCGGGELIPVETSTDKILAQHFDKLAGIDAWQIVGGRGMRGIASRVQWEAAYQSFTIRTLRVNGNETEMIKLLRARKNTNGFIFPHLTVQAYFTKRRIGDLIYCCMTRTADIVRFSSQKYKDNIWTEKTNDQESGRSVIFRAFWVEALQASRVAVREFNKNDPRVRRHQLKALIRDPRQIELFSGDLNG